MSKEFEMEQSLLGGLMKINNSSSDIVSYVLRSLKPNAFYHRVHSEIYKAIKILSSSDKQFDQLSVASYIDKHSDIGFVEVDRCYSHSCTSDVFRQYTQTIKDAAIERYALSKITDLQDVIANHDNGTITQRIGLAESIISGIMESVESRKSQGLKSGHDIASEWLDDMDDFLNGKSHTYDLGVAELDALMKPKQVKPGSLVVVGARPKMGKTFLATKMVCHYLTNRDEGVSVFSLEMRSVDIWERMLSEKAKSNSNNFYTIPMDNTGYWDSIGNSNSELANSKIAICDTGGITIGFIKSEVRKQQRIHKHGLIVIDYLTLMGSDKEAERNDLKYGEITKELKLLAKELGCVVLLLTQLNRGLESRTDKRPMPSDSRDTGQIEQDCDVWIGLYRERVYDKNAPYNYTEAIVRLNRNGGDGTAYMTLENGYFEDVNTIEAQAAITAYEDKGVADEQTQKSQYSGYKKQPTNKG
jgi:replicative DNA helicase